MISLKRKIVLFNKDITRTITLKQYFSSQENISFLTPGSPEGVLSNRPCPSVRWSVVGPSFSETVHWFFLIFWMKLGHRKGTKVTVPDF